MKYSHREKGQATMELCIGLLGIVFVVIAILYFGGIGITSIKTLLNARYYAEYRASEGSSSPQGSEVRKTISQWYYTSAGYKNSQVRAIPFLAHDIPKSGETFSNDYFRTAEFSSGSMPAEEDTEHLQYEFIPLNDVRTGIKNYNSTVESGSPADLSNLRASEGILPEELERSGEEVYTMHRTPNARLLKNNLRSKGFFDFTTVKIIEWRSNTAAYPAFKQED